MTAIFLSESKLKLGTLLVVATKNACHILRFPRQFVAPKAQPVQLQQQQQKLAVKKTMPYLHLSAFYFHFFVLQK